MHKDQTRAKETILARMLRRAESENPSDVRDCTVLVRLFEQGPDPLYLMETCPIQFRDLCRNLGISQEDGRKAIEAAHWQGPGVLLNGTGIQRGAISFDKEWLPEALWLLMASASACTEEGYDGTMPEREKIAIAQKAAVNLFQLSVWDRRALVNRAIEELESLCNNVSFEMDERGFPHTDKDHGFYLAYKQGFKVCAVKAGPLTFWGTTPDTTLEAQGIVVDKNISPCFGIVFPKE